MAKKLTELFKEAIAKAKTEEGRRELAKERKRMEVGALQAARKAAQTAPAPPEGGEDAQTAPGGPQAGEKPPDVRAVARVDPILPVVQSVREHPARQMGRLAFGGLVEGRELPAQLPLLPTPEGPRVPLLELSDYRGVPTMARGRGAPLDLRLAVASCVMTPMALRSTQGRIVATVRDLRDFLFPHGWKRWRDWPRIRDALYRASSYSFPGPFRIPEGLAKRWIPFGLQVEPGENAGLDDLVVIRVEFPPDSGNGPVIAGPELFRLGVISGPKFRAYIAAHSVAWRPGVSRRPHPRNRRFHMWSSDPRNYTLLTRADRRRLAFGIHDRGHRTHAQQDAAWEDLPGVEILTRKASTPDGGRGWLVVPEKAAEAIRKPAAEDEWSR